MANPGLLSRFTNSGHYQVNSVGQTCRGSGVNLIMARMEGPPSKIFDSGAAV